MPQPSLEPNYCVVFAQEVVFRRWSLIKRFYSKLHQHQVLTVSVSISHFHCFQLPSVNYTVGPLIFEDIKFCRFSNFSFKEKISRIQASRKNLVSSGRIVRLATAEMWQYSSAVLLVVDATSSQLLNRHLVFWNCLVAVSWSIAAATQAHARLLHGQRCAYNSCHLFIAKMFIWVCLSSVPSLLVITWR